MRDIQLEALKSLVKYDPETGIFTLLVKSGRFSAGHQYSYINSSGYVEIAIQKKRFTAHRLAWFYMTSSWPVAFVDHINGTKADNRWCNLREAGPEINQQNRRLPKKNSSSGFIGVSKRLNGKKESWRAEIYVNKKTQILGYFDDPYSAHLAYVEAKRICHPGGML